VSEVDVNGQVLSTFMDVREPFHLSADSEDQILVADNGNHRLLLLGRKLHLERVLIDRTSEFDLQWPTRLSFDELTSQVCIVHDNYRDYFLSKWSLRD